MEINRADVLAEVTEAFDRYEAAFQRNDLEVLDELFWDDPRVVRFGVAEDNYGIDAVRAFRTGQGTEDLRRTLTRTTITTFGDSAAVAFIEFRRDASGVQGRQSQTWVRTAAGWRVVAAHVSHVSQIPQVPQVPDLSRLAEVAQVPDIAQTAPVAEPR